MEIVVRIDPIRGVVLQVGVVLRGVRVAKGGLGTCCRSMLESSEGTIGGGVAIYSGCGGLVFGPLGLDKGGIAPGLKLLWGQLLPLLGSGSGGLGKSGSPSHMVGVAAWKGWWRRIDVIGRRTGADEHDWRTRTGSIEGRHEHRRVEGGGATSAVAGAHGGGRTPPENVDARAHRGGRGREGAATGGSPRSRDGALEMRKRYRSRKPNS
jgi:hypothetical protein